MISEHCYLTTAAQLSCASADSVAFSGSRREEVSCRHSRGWTLTTRQAKARRQRAYWIRRPPVLSRVLLAACDQIGGRPDGTCLERRFPAFGKLRPEKHTSRSGQTPHFLTNSRVQGPFPSLLFARLHWQIGQLQGFTESTTHESNTCHANYDNAGLLYGIKKKLSTPGSKTNYLQDQKQIISPWGAKTL